jgi:hypothetical protein
MNADLEPTTIPNLAAVKAVQKPAWESGVFGQIARTLEPVAEDFMARQRLQPGSCVLSLMLRPQRHGRLHSCDETCGAVVFFGSL